MTIDDLLARTRPEGECRIWTKAVSGDGYPAVGHNGKMVGAHRLMCELVYGEANGRHALHNRECTSIRCVAPWHLKWGSHKENMRDRAEWGRQREVNEKGWKTRRMKRELEGAV